MKNVYLHMGYPKCLSTTLQRNIFPKHPEINYGGIGEGDILGYVNDSAELLFESILKYSNDHFYRSFLKDHKQVITEFVKTSELPVVFSSEHMSMNFTLQGIDSLTKYQRIQEIFKNNSINILLIKRNPISFIRSIYSEFVKMGYSESYNEFLRWLIRYSDRNFLLDLNYDSKERQLRDVFGDINIKWLEFESITTGDVEQNINKSISEWVGVSNLKLDCTTQNKGLDKNEITSLRLINKETRRELGLSQTEPFERHRNKLILSRFEDESYIFDNVVQKRLAFDELKNRDISWNEEFKSTKLENQILDIIG